MGQGGALLQSFGSLSDLFQSRRLAYRKGSGVRRGDTHHAQDFVLWPDH